MIVDPKAKLNDAYVKSFIESYHPDKYDEYDYSSYSKMMEVSRRSDAASGNERLAMFREAVENYGKRISEGKLNKGTRPWHLTDVTKNNDPSQAWIGLEWETGFCTRAEYKATVQYMWQTHHNWALDAEGIGPYFGEFTFPPINLSDWVEGKSMLDDMRQWMASKNIITPSTFGQIDFRGSGVNRNNFGGANGDATEGWGCHVNISVPGARDNDELYRIVSKYMYKMSGMMSEFSESEKNQVFGRWPYGYIHSRSDSANEQRWHEWKLFRTPVTDEDVENIRSVSTRIAELTAHVAAHPKDFMSVENRVMTLHLPTRSNLFDYLSGKESMLTLTDTATDFCDLTVANYFNSLK